MMPNKCKCGNDAYVSHIYEYASRKSIGYYVYCENCERKGLVKATMEEAIATWNEEEENYDT